MTGENVEAFEVIVEVLDSNCQLLKMHDANVAIVKTSSDMILSECFVNCCFVYLQM